jgi:NAD(P)-dependent dehydrogenase (short-subunit alcohol dehydrogenase family)
MSEKPNSRLVLITGCSRVFGMQPRSRFTKRAGEPSRVLVTLAIWPTSLRAVAGRCSLMSATTLRGVIVVRTIEREHGPIDALINNAGYGQYGPIETIELKAVRRAFATNVFALLHLTQLVLPSMRRVQRGRIVDVSSIAGRIAMPGGGILLRGIARRRSPAFLEAIPVALMRFMTITFVVFCRGSCRPTYSE